MAAVDYIAKLKRSLGLAFGKHFLHDFYIKCSLFNALSMDKVLMQGGHSFSKNNFQDISRTFQDIWDIFPGHFLLDQV